MGFWISNTMSTSEKGAELVGGLVEVSEGEIEGKGEER